MNNIDYTKNKLLINSKKSNLSINYKIVNFNFLSEIFSDYSNLFTFNNENSINQEVKNLNFNKYNNSFQNLLKEKYKNNNGIFYFGDSIFLKKWFISKDNTEYNKIKISSLFLEEKKMLFYDDFYNSDLYRVKCIRCGGNIKNFLYSNSTLLNEEICPLCEKILDEKYLNKYNHHQNDTNNKKISIVNSLDLIYLTRESSNYYKTYFDIDDIASENHYIYVNEIRRLGLMEYLNLIRLEEAYQIEKNSRKSIFKYVYWYRISNFFKVTRIYCSNISRKIWSCLR